MIYLKMGRMGDCARSGFSFGFRLFGAGVLVSIGFF